MMNKICEVCGEPAVVMTADLAELEPMECDGSLWESWATLKRHSYCAEHKKPGTREYLDGRIVTNA